MPNGRLLVSLLLVSIWLLRPPIRSIHRVHWQGNTIDASMKPISDRVYNGVVTSAKVEEGHMAIVQHEHETGKNQIILWRIQYTGICQSNDFFLSSDPGTEHLSPRISVVMSISTFPAQSNAVCSVEDDDNLQATVAA